MTLVIFFFTLSELIHIWKGLMFLKPKLSQITTKKSRYTKLKDVIPFTGLELSWHKEIAVRAQLTLKQTRQTAKGLLEKRGLQRLKKWIKRVIQYINKGIKYITYLGPMRAIIWSWLPLHYVCSIFNSKFSAWT